MPEPQDKDKKIVDPAPKDKDKKKPVDLSTVDPEVLNAIAERERAKVYTRIETAEAESKALKTRLEVLETDKATSEAALAQAQKDKDDVAVAAEQAKIDALKEKSEEFRSFVEQTDATIAELNSTVEKIGEEAEKRVNDVTARLNKKDIALEKAKIIAEHRKDGIVEELITGNTVEELLASVTTAKTAYAKIAGPETLEKLGYEKRDPSLPDGTSHESGELPLTSDVEEIASDPRFTDNESFHTKLNGYRKKSKEALAAHEGRKKAIFGEMMKRKLL